MCHFDCAIKSQLVEKKVSIMPSKRHITDITNLCDLAAPRQPIVLLKWSPNPSFYTMARPTVGCDLSPNLRHLSPPSCQMSFHCHRYLANPWLHLPNFWHSWFLESISSAF